MSQRKRWTERTDALNKLQVERTSLQERPGALARLEELSQFEDEFVNLRGSGLRLYG